MHVECPSDFLRADEFCWMLVKVDDVKNIVTTNLASALDKIIEEMEKDSGGTKRTN